MQWCFIHILCSCRIILFYSDSQLPANPLMWFVNLLVPHHLHHLWLVFILFTQIIKQSHLQSQCGKKYIFPSSVVCLCTQQQSSCQSTASHHILRTHLVNRTLHWRLLHMSNRDSLHDSLIPTPPLVPPAPSFFLKSHLLTYLKPQW